jgi:hypothetical protein
VKRENEAHAFVTTPVFNGTKWRLLGGVLWTVWDDGGGLIHFVVSNTLSYGVKAVMSWSYAGLTGGASKWVGGMDDDFLKVQLPQGFDATFEILCSKLP